jgi:LPXTG-motif cell wall-anchored protein
MRHHIVLAAVAGLCLFGAGAANAQPDEDDPIPRLDLLIAEATCDDQGTARVTVWVDDARDAPLEVRLDGLGPEPTSRTGQTTLDEERGMHVVTFQPVAAGDYNVHADRAPDQPAADLPVTVEPCSKLEPSDDPFRVEVECRNGWGVVTFIVANQGTGEVAEYSIQLDDLPEPSHVVALSGGMFLRVAETPYEDKDYTAQLTGNGVDITEEFTVACEFGNPPTIDVSYTCAGGTAQVAVGVLNPNRGLVEYDVVLSRTGVSKQISVAGGQRGVVTFPNVEPGREFVTVTEENAQASTIVRFECGVTTTTPTTTSSSGAAVTTTTVSSPPAPQARSGGDLPSTGAAVGGLVGLAGLALALGGALLLIGRRRRATP